MAKNDVKCLNAHSINLLSLILEKDFLSFLNYKLTFLEGGNQEEEK